MTDRQRHGLILLLVAGLIAVSAVLIATKPTRLGLDLKGGVELVYKGIATPQSPVNTASLNRAVDVMRNRVDQLGVTEPQIQTEGNNLIDVQLPDIKNITEAENTVGSTARLVFYDWEANALTPTGQTVASQLPVGETNALAISQAGGLTAPGTNSSAAGAMGFYEAVKLASKQPAAPSDKNQVRGSTYFLFGAPGSSACKAYAEAQKTKPQSGVHCLIAGPYQPPQANTSYTTAVQQLEQGLSAAEKAGTEVLVVKQGTVVLQAAPASFSKWPKYGTPTAGYFVLKDNVSLFGDQVTNPQQSTSAAGQPDVTFGLTSKGANEFQSVTQKIAQRGSLLSVGHAQPLVQHFAIALDNQLISVPSIDFKQYPDGITGGGGAEITGGFTISTAQALATQLRLGALPIKLQRVSESQVSATLGSQALHQGLIAGIVGLAIVVLFLLFFYRLLGLIAVGGLLAYGIYFFALIKLIPITMTLAGIAGLILTIGVAADANIVIFERVKEEIRAGRSVRQGIAIGYRKGLTAIIDANVVTIMTAFILFVLATADVKGFAFTLGIGTFVSLFTAVLATQAILMTLGDTQVIRHPALLGAGPQKRKWRFDFMGASRWFFSMSGVILLVGALAIGGKGLNLGIDFTSGTQISAALQKPATVNEIKTLVSDAGGGNATVQLVKNSGSLGEYGVQISLKYLNVKESQNLRNALEQRYGIKTNANGNVEYNSTSVGPTFGSAVTKSAVIAIAISLFLISLYITLRFEWKFAVPVLIALMHDLLITAGVYALTGRVVTAETVAALLTILGYSMYDTIIVFDRVRENIPRMPRAAFSQIVNRSMSEVLTRSLATTTSTLLPVIALLLFGGSTLKDFAFALLIGVASGAYSSIFIASPVLTHWKEREHGFAARRARIEADLGYVPAYAEGGDVEPTSAKVRRGGRLTAPEADTVSAAEFEQMKRDLGLEQEQPAKPAKRPPKAQPKPPAKPPAKPAASATAVEEQAVSEPTEEPTISGGEQERPVTPAPDIAENEGVVNSKSDSRSRKRSRNRRHGRKR